MDVEDVVPDRTTPRVPVKTLVSSMYAAVLLRSFRAVRMENGIHIVCKWRSKQGGQSFPRPSSSLSVLPLLTNGDLADLILSKRDSLSRTPIGRKVTLECDEVVIFETDSADDDWYMPKVNEPVFEICLLHLSHWALC